MSEIRKILKEHVGYDTCGDKECLSYELLGEAEKAIMAWHTAEVKRIIGEDDDVSNEASTLFTTRNKLRAEQRERGIDG